MSFYCYYCYYGIYVIVVVVMLVVVNVIVAYIPFSCKYEHIRLNRNSGELETNISDLPFYF